MLTDRGRTTGEGPALVGLPGHLTGEAEVGGKAAMCPASSWHVRLGATDGRGGMVCPVCGIAVLVQVLTGYQGRICRIREHADCGDRTDGWTGSR